MIKDGMNEQSTCGIAHCSHSVNTSLRAPARGGMTRQRTALSLLHPRSMLDCRDPDGAPQSATVLHAELP